MHIWVDADACPRVIKEIIYRAAERVMVKTTLVANAYMGTPRSEYIDLLIVPGGLDVADNQILKLVSAGDLVITADIPLAAEVIAKNAFALDPRGEFLTENNIGERLAIRDFMTGLRGSGIETGGPAPFSKRDRQEFANELDRFLAKRLGG